MSEKIVARGTVTSLEGQQYELTLTYLNGDLDMDQSSELPDILDFKLFALQIQELRLGGRQISTKEPLRIKWLFNQVFDKIFDVQYIGCIEPEMPRRQGLGC